MTERKLIKQIESKWGKTKKVEKLIRRFSRGLSLDAGCGEGIYHNSFKGSIIAVDLTLPFLLSAKNTNKLPEYIYSTIKYLPFKSGVFNYVFCSSVIAHIYESDVNRVIQELERVTKENGVIQIDTPNENNILSLLRKILFGSWKYDEEYRKQYNDDNLLHYHSIWTKNRLESMGYVVRGCLGWKTQQYLKSKGLEFLARFYTSIVWYLANIAGTLIGLKKK